MFALSLPSGEPEEFVNLLIVTRQVSTVEWLRRRGIFGEVTGDVESVSEVAGRDLIGACPLWLAAEARSYTQIVIPGQQLRQRGQVLTADEMDARGAYLARFRLERVALPERFSGLEYLGE
jgi:hypothetical protein